MQKKIFIVDDDPSLRDVFKMIFERAGFDVVIEASGDNILNGTHAIPDIYLLDRQLPGANGLDICRYLKANEATRNIPVLMVTAATGIETEAKLAGADGYIEKPFSIKHLLSMINKHLENKE